MGEFEALTFEDLFEGTKAIPWEKYIGKKDAFPVKGYSINSALSDNCFVISTSPANNIHIFNDFLKNIQNIVWWAQMESNHRPHAYQACALTI